MDILLHYVGNYWVFCGSDLISLISNKMYSLIPLCKILDLEVDDLSLYISSDTELKTTKTV